MKVDISEFAPRTYSAFTKANIRLIGNSWKDGRFKVWLAAALLVQKVLVNQFLIDSAIG